MKPPEEKTGARNFYLPELDVLRFFAFFAVFLHHNFSHEPANYQGILAPAARWISSAVIAGGFGVDLFFALSSYLITELLLRESEKNGSINAVAFYARRALRIFPLYYFFILLSIFVFPYFIAGDSLGFPHSVSFLFFSANWTCAVYGFPDSVAGPLWSIAIEEQFYLVFPFLLGFCGAANVKRLAVAFLIVAFAARAILIYTDASDVAIWCNTFARLDPIALGILFAVFVREGKIKAVKKMATRLSLIIFALALYVGSVYYLDFYGGEAFVLYPAAAIASVLLIWAFWGAPFHMRPLVYLGRISYGLYVFHVLGIKLTEQTLKAFGIDGTYFTFLQFFPALAITIILSVLSYKYLEKPFLSLKKKFTVVESRPV